MSNNNLEQFNNQIPSTPDNNQSPFQSETNSNPDKLQPISEDTDSISYLGIRLEKAISSDSKFVPDKENYADYINDKFSLNLQKKIAVSLATGEPLLMEGGTSIGKTTTIKKMCAELGYEVHYANLNGETDVENLMGRYIPNVFKSKADDPEYVFADGKITSGLRQENDKTKVIILDEFNSAAPNVLIRLHEVIDSLERNSNIVLSEDASEQINVSKDKTKVIALTNPPGKGYFGREPLDPAQLRRWVYIKEASELPEDSAHKYTEALFGLSSKIENIDKSQFLHSLPKKLSAEQLVEIPGLAEIVAKYDEFHQAAKEMVKNRSIAADQPQLFTFDDRVEKRRVRDFVLHFFNGDINQTFQEALRYYYVNKLELAEDKDKLEELIVNVAYIPTSEESKRTPLEEENDQPISERNDSTAEKGERINFNDLEKFLKTNNLEKHLAGGSFEALIKKQETFYQKMYGRDFTINRSDIFIETLRLKNIKKGLENGCVNYPLLTVIPEKLSSKEKDYTEAELAYDKLLSPQKGLKIWAEEGTDRWTGLTLKECLQGYIPVDIEDFKVKELEADWVKEIQRVIEFKKQAHRVKPGEIKLIFTDNRQDVPADQKLINQDGQKVNNEKSFIEMIKNKVKVLNPDQWITLAAQKYHNDKEYLSRNTWDWTMAVLDHKGKKTDPPCSAAFARSDDGGVGLNSGRAGDGDGGIRRWRLAL